MPCGQITGESRTLKAIISQRPFPSMQLTDHQSTLIFTLNKKSDKLLIEMFQ